ncbi:MAG: hypothetical protein LBD67_07325 [Candidatus Accumulibacter sp.]|jgi:hypothetical protein|nr:hypothetical protein [Accumulibacter sp.]
MNGLSGDSPASGQMEFFGYLLFQKRVIQKMPQCADVRLFGLKRLYHYFIMTPSGNRENRLLGQPFRKEIMEVSRINTRF